MLFLKTSVLDLNLINFVLLALTIKLYCINWISSNLAIELKYPLAGLIKRQLCTLHVHNWCSVCDNKILYYWHTANIFILNDCSNECKLALSLSSHFFIIFDITGHYHYKIISKVNVWKYIVWKFKMNWYHYPP